MVEEERKGFLITDVKSCTEGSACRRVALRIGAVALWLGVTDKTVRELAKQGRLRSGSKPSHRRPT